MTKSTPVPHIAVMAFPYGSQALTLIRLAYRLACAAPGVEFSFFNTAPSNKVIFNALNSQLPNNLKTYDVEDGLPPPSNDQHFFTRLEMAERFLIATPNNFKKAMDAVVAETGRGFNCLLTDVLLLFACEMAEEMHIPWITVWIPAPCAFYSHIYTDLIRQLHADEVSNPTTTRPEEKTLESIPGLSQFRFMDLHEDIIITPDQETLFSHMISTIGQVVPRARALVMNSYEGLSPAELTNDLKSTIPAVLNVGLFSLHLHQSLQQHSWQESGATDCLPWLDAQKPRSVVYISFGTADTPPPEDLAALAEALEKSGVAYLWSLPKHLNHILPTGFHERSSHSMKGKVVSWAPQTQVLAHSSLAVFVTQGGYNSLCESIKNEVPFIIRPIFSDQKMIARMVDHVWEIGVTVEGFVITKQGMITSLELVMSGEKGKKIRENIRALKEVIDKDAGPNGSATQDFKTLVDIISSF